MISQLFVCTAPNKLEVPPLNQVDYSHKIKKTHKIEIHGYNKEAILGFSKPLNSKNHLYFELSWGKINALILSYYKLNRPNEVYVKVSKIG